MQRVESSVRIHEKLQFFMTINFMPKMKLRSRTLLLIIHLIAYLALFIHTAGAIWGNYSNGLAISYFNILFMWLPFVLSHVALYFYTLRGANHTQVTDRQAYLEGYKDGVQQVMEHTRSPALMLEEDGELYELPAKRKNQRES